jgi:hypothetical protein
VPIADPDRLKTPQAPKRGEWISQINQDWRRSETVIALNAIRGEIYSINFSAFLHSQDPNRTSSERCWFHFGPRVLPWLPDADTPADSASTRRAPGYPSRAVTECPDAPGVGIARASRRMSMPMRPGTTVVTALSPRCELPKFGSGLNTIAIHRGLIGIRMSYPRLSCFLKVGVNESSFQAARLSSRQHRLIS